MRPLISCHSTPSIITNFLGQTASSRIAHTCRNANIPVRQPVPQWAQPTRFDVDGSARSYAYDSTARPFVTRGWARYALPHGILYYVNEESRVTTDLDLRNPSQLEEVSNVLDMADSVPEGSEMWVRLGMSSKNGWWKHKAGAEKPMLLWVDHRYRRVLHEVPSDDYVSSDDSKPIAALSIVVSVLTQQTGLDDEYRYWTFIEMHPAHVAWAIVEGARKDAIDMLHWSYTDCLLTHPHLSPILPPFNQGECLELLKLLDGKARLVFLYDLCLIASSRPKSYNYSSIHSSGCSHSFARW